MQTGGGPGPGQGDAPGGRPKKALRPARRRELVDGLRACYDVSIRQACAVVQTLRSNYHYRPRLRVLRFSKITRGFAQTLVCAGIFVQRA